MPVYVSLEALVSVPNTRPLWPVDFAALIKTLEEHPDDSTPWGVTADWVDEEAREPGYAAAFRWVAKKGVKVREDVSYRPPRWVFDGLHSALTAGFVPRHIDETTIPGAVAKLAELLRGLRAVLDLEAR